MAGKFDELKVALVIDDLLERDVALRFFEEIVGLFPNSTIYTYAHQQGKIHGVIEQRKIVSTFLSKKIKSYLDWTQYQFLIPRAKENLVIPCHYDLCIKFSRGFAHAVPVCQGVPVLTYLFDISRVDLPQRKLRQRFFRKYIQKFFYDTFEQINDPLFSSESLKTLVGNKNEDNIISPGIDIEKYKELPQALQKNEILLIDTNSIEHRKDRLELINFFSKNDSPFRFIGKDIGIQTHYLGQDCSTDDVSLFSHTKAFVLFSHPSFPDLAVKAYHCGVPVYYFENNPSYQAIYHKLNFQKLNSKDQLCSLPEKLQQENRAKMSLKDWKKSLIQKISQTLLKQNREHANL